MHSMISIPTCQQISQSNVFQIHGISGLKIHVLGGILQMVTKKETVRRTSMGAELVGMLIEGP